MPETYTRLVQIIHETNGRRVALVNQGELHLLSTYRSVYNFARAAIDTGVPLRELLSSDLSGIVLDYGEVYAMRSSWSFLPSFDHPETLACCLVTGFANGPNRKSEPRPVAPPWFYKGNGMHLRAHSESLTIPSFALSGGEEGELAAVYLIDQAGQPRRVGLTPANEFADPAMANLDPRMLPYSKIATCSIGPELVLDADFGDIDGSVQVERAGEKLWSSPLKTGNVHTTFTIAELEQVLFRYPGHRVPGDVHIVFLGGSASTFKDGVALDHGDKVIVEWQGFGRPLRNPIEREKDSPAPTATSL